MKGINRIYFGAPGTGKSYKVTKDIEKIYPEFTKEGSLDSQFVFRTTLHPEYTYNDFVGQLLPDVNGNDITYTFQTGVFTDALWFAEHNSYAQVFLVLEELSRANVAAVFGDLFQLLDRDKTGTSEYAINNALIADKVYDGRKNKKVKIPNNLTILATVNTNDQNVFVMDTAFKRRFEWEYVGTEPDQDENVNNREITVCRQDGSTLEMSWIEFYPLLNEFITSNMGLSEDKQIGQFFIKFSGDEKFDRDQIKNKLLQYLWEDVNTVSYDEKLFQSDLLSFGACYQRFDRNGCVFSGKFIEKLDDFLKNGKRSERDGQFSKK
ncbi:AAA family ATPase [Loigolactobacillus coryniformis]|uniref:Uncharacterized protein n=1 Tax=Loigolactobacillus coryniformis subsp. torquens DSM 20004 = KCTC 3535 TaxID=1423822 RepID=A0A2D1KP88_9LACO|nr:AAA family ATPase [Loigolactobacillus coryniformis]ATO43926.1 hypothetical protein LC20004_08360 [Loigolactobacillus coryniformis subsp. torquens DSM 20004 = KCTC 3535]KRK74446.1 restriction enzyme [Loigolactobacillus coryniformis subsp. torquens DSM 20004 = KCTC 3535]